MMKKARTHRTVDFDDRRDPGCVANWRLRCKLAEVLTKAPCNPAEFGGWFDYVFVVDAGCVFQNEQLYLFLECSRLFGRQSYFRLLFVRPDEKAIECLRGQVGCEEGDGVEA